MALVALYVGPDLTTAAHAECLRRVGCKEAIEPYLMMLSTDTFCCDICLGSDPDRVELLTSAPVLEEVIANILSDDDDPSLRHVIGFYPGDHGPKCTCGWCVNERTEK